MRRIDWVSLALVLLIAALLRLGGLGANPFGLDEALISQPALRLAREGWLPPFGTISSVGVPFLPAGTWVFALPYLFTSDPLAATVFVGVLNVLAVAGVWLIGWRRFGTTGATVTGLMLAAMPHAVMYSRGIWQPDLLIPLAVLWLWAADSVLRAATGWRLAALVFLGVLAVQIHFAGAALSLATAFLVLRGGWWRRPAPLIVGAAIAALGAVPFLAQVACCGLTTVNRMGETPPALRISTESLDNLLHLSLGLGWQTTTLGERDIHGFGEAALPAVMAAVLIITGAVGLAELWRRGENRRFAEVIAAGLVAPVLLFLVHTSPVNPYYQLPALPFVALMAGAAMTGLSARAVRGGLLILSAAAVAVWGGLLGLSINLAGQINTPNGLGIPLWALRDAAYGLPDDAPAILHTSGGDTGVDGHASAFRVLWWDRPENRIVTGDSLLLLPNTPVYWLVEVPPMQAWEEITDAGLGARQGSFPRREGEPIQPWAYHDGTTAPTGFTLLDAPVRFADGTELEGWRVRMVGPRLRISTLWRLANPEQAALQGTDIHQFHHLRRLDTDASQPPDAVSDVPVTLHRWQAGDRAILMADFLLDFEGEVTLEIGHYRLSDMAVIPRMDASGHVLRLGQFDTRDILAPSALP